MQALLVIGTVMSVVGTISAGEAQAKALEQQSAMYMQQASVYSSQIEMEISENQRRIAVEKSAETVESLKRTEKLQRIIGSTIAQGASAGINANYGTITSINEHNAYESSIEEALARSNSENRIVSMNLNSTISQQNFANKAGQAVFSANQAIDSANETRFQSYMKAGSTLMSFGAGQMNAGSVPQTDMFGNPYSDVKMSEITWNS